jgi:hypothetical protein
LETPALFGVQNDYKFLGKALYWDGSCVAIGGAVAKVAICTPQNQHGICDHKVLLAYLSEIVLGIFMQCKTSHYFDRYLYFTVPTPENDNQIGRESYNPL